MSTVLAVCARAGHHFSKPSLPSIEIVAGLGVAGDGHAGTTVQHRSRVALDPTKPNLRQVHLMHAELFEELAARGYRVQPGDLGENVTTRGVDLLGLPTGTVLRLGKQARVQLTGLRNPCTQLDAFAPGLMKALLERRPDGVLVRKAGVMAIVLDGGRVAPGDAIQVERPAEPWSPLAPV